MNKGNYWKVKTKKYLEADGFLVEYLEKLQRIVTKDGKVIFIKRDLLESDGLACNSERFILWNSTTKEHIAEHLKRYAKLELPAFIERWVVVWALRQREPEIVEFNASENYD